MGPMGADLVHEARRRAGLTQRELAERAGTTQSAVARWESGRSEPAFATVVRLVRLCGFVMDVHLEPYDDGLRDDWSQAQRSLPLTPEQRLAQLVTFVRRMEQARGTFRPTVEPVGGA